VNRVRSGAATEVAVGMVGSGGSLRQISFKRQGGAAAGRYVAACSSQTLQTVVLPRAGRQTGNPEVGKAVFSSVTLCCRRQKCGYARGLLFSGGGGNGRPKWRCR